ncbi:MAG: restriction endonuclease, partial [Actinomycetota bacterium]|nr:restriction endonuclease [Actinomycetota bacterium]
MMAASRVHSEWLSLVEISGPFLTLPVLTRAFPAGLEPTDRELVEELRVAYAEVTDDPTLSPRFIRWVLERLLDLPNAVLRHGAAVPGRLTHRVSEYAVELRPDYAVIDPDADAPEPRARLLVAEWPWGIPLDERPFGSPWAATPTDRMEELCRATGVRLGLVTNGETWTLLDAPAGGARGTATWDAELWLEERSTLDAFTTLLGGRRFFSVGEPETLEALLAESANAEAEVTDQLGRQVRRAVELLIDAWSRVNRERHGQLFGPLTHAEVYEGAVTVLMRLVFLLCAEERGLFVLGDPLYDSSYAVSTLRAQLEEEANTYGEDVLERHSGAWHRLLATFRMVHAGAQHENLSLPAYGGSLFDPDRFGWIEGRHPSDPPGALAAAPVPVDDRTVLHVLDALQVLRFRRRGDTDEARHVSFRTLDVEQIGHVYEGLLDQGAVAVDDVVLGLSGKKEPELRLEEIEAHAAQGSGALVSWLVEQTGLSAKAVAKALEPGATSEERTRLASACDNEHTLVERITPYLRLLRRDLRGLPRVWLPGSIVMTRAGDRRSSGTYYTPKALAEEMVRHALEPLVYQPGPAEGANPEDWKLQPSAELLDLRICDMAMGSGAFLVAACRYLAARVLEAWSAEGLSAGDPVGPPGGETVPLPGEETDQEILALRLVADRCLYGVDRNSMAVEMAKLSLWLVTLAKDRPFSFLDHALRAGDSLLGVTSLEQIEYLHFDPTKGVKLHGGTLFDPATVVRPLLGHALRLRRRIESFLVLDVADAEAKRALFAQARKALDQIAVIANVVVGAALSTATQAEAQLEGRLLAIAPEVRAALDPGRRPGDQSARIEDLRLRAEYWLDEGRPPMAPDRVCFHWPLEFPEVFVDRERPGFDAVVGNPPFLGGKRISGPYGTTYREHLVKAIAGGRTGNADLVTYFFLRGSQVVRHGGSIALLSTNTIAQGDTREVGLDWLTAHGWSIPRAVKSRPWPGDASLEIAQVWLYRGEWKSQASLEGRAVKVITPALEPASRASGTPHRLRLADKRSFIGSALNTDQFILLPEEAERLIDADPRNAEVVMPYMNGDDLNSRPDCSASRWVINFRDWPLEHAQEYSKPFALVRERVMPEVCRKVEEAKRSGSKSYVGWDKRWWQFWNVRAKLYSTIEQMERVLVIARISKTVQPVLLPNGAVFNEKTVVFGYDDGAHFGLLASSLHYWWTLSHSSSLRTDLNYAP